ncbi:hypothetical protein, partial [Photobacterium damselae]
PAALANIIQNDDLVLTQGAGDVGKIARQLAELKLDIAAMQGE